MSSSSTHLPTPEGPGSVSAEYIEAWWNAVTWAEVERHYEIGYR